MSHSSASAFREADVQTRRHVQRFIRRHIRRQRDALNALRRPRHALCATHSARTFPPDPWQPRTPLLSARFCFSRHMGMLESRPLSLSGWTPGPEQQSFLQDDQLIPRPCLSGLGPTGLRSARRCPGPGHLQRVEAFGHRGPSRSLPVLDDDDKSCQEGSRAGFYVNAGFQLMRVSAQEQALWAAW